MPQCLSGYSCPWKTCPAGLYMTGECPKEGPNGLKCLLCPTGTFRPDATTTSRVTAAQAEAETINIFAAWLREDDDSDGCGRTGALCSRVARAVLA